MNIDVRADAVHARGYVGIQLTAQSRIEPTIQSMISSTFRSSIQSSMQSSIQSVIQSTSQSNTQLNLHGASQDNYFEKTQLFSH